MPTQTQTVTIAQALASTSSGLLVLDTAANIAAALPNSSLTARVSSFSVTATAAAPAIITVPQFLLLAPLGANLHAPAGSLKLNSTATVTAAQLVAMEAVPGFTVGSAANLTLSDSTANVVALLASHPAYFANLATVTVHLDGTSVGAYPASQLEGLYLHGKVLNIVPTGAYTTLNVAAMAHDLGSNSASLSLLDLQQPVSFTLLNEGATVIAADAAGLASLTGFHVSAHVINVSDTAANLQAHASLLFGQGFTQIQVLSGTFAGSAAQLLDPTLHFAAGAHASLAASATLGGAAAATLVGLPGFSLASGATLAVTDTAANLAATDAAWLHVAGSATVSASGSINAAAATSLAQLAGVLGHGFSLGGHSLTITDTLANLLGLSASASGLATASVLTADATASAAMLIQAAALPGFSLGGHVVTVADTAANLLGLAGAARADGGAFQLSADATVSAAGFAALRGLPQFTTQGHALVVSDTAANLASLSGNAAPATGCTLSASATVSAAQITAIAALPGVSLGGFTLAVSDTAAQLLALSPQALALAGSVTLSADATVTAAQAQVLAADPGFSPGTHHLTIADTAANLLALPTALQLAATSLTLSANQTATAAMLGQLAALGIKFSEAGHSVIVADTAANIAALPAATLALASAEVIAQPAIVSAATAQMLAGLPHLSLAAGATLTVQDSVANLIALGSGAPGVTTSEQLVPGSMVTITAAQGHALAGIAGFSPAGATITVADSVANLGSPADAGWQSVAAATQVVDTAANLAAGAASPLVHSAGSVTLSGNGTVSAAQAAQIATIAHFSAGTAQLTVSDTAAAIAANAPAVLAVATAAVVTDSGPISTAVANQLASVSAAHLLTFQGGDQLLVQDSYAALTDPANSAGVALAARLGVLDTAANLVAATGHDWGGVNPTYSLDASGVISAAQAQVLAGLGGHFSANGYALSEADSAANVAGSGASLASLHITASVSDSAANIAARAANLVALGSALAVVHTTDIAAVPASLAAGLSGLAAKLSGAPLLVADTAADVNGVISQLRMLGTHVAITVTDSAANVAQVSLDLAGLHGALSVVLTDSQPVTAAIAAGIAPVAGSLAAGTSLSVQDSAADIVADAPALAALGGDLGTLTLTDGSVQTAATAAALAPLDAHLGGVRLTVVDTGADVTANEAGLLRLASDGALAAVRVLNTSVADAAGNAAALNALDAQVSISDSAADVQAGLGALAGISGLGAIVLTDGGTPTLTLGIAALAAGQAVLPHIVSPYSLAVADTAADIQADIVHGHSVLAAQLAGISQITVTDGQPVVLTQAQILAAGIDDSAGSVLGRMAGAVQVTGADVAHLAQLVGLSHAPALIGVADTAADISADLASGAGSVLVANSASLSGISVTDGLPVQLTAAQVLAAGVDDSIGSVLARIGGGAALSVSNASIAQLAAMHGLFVQPGSIAVVDSGADLSADLASGNSQLLQDAAAISTITVQDHAPIVLTAQQAEAVGVDDGAGSLLAKLSGAPLYVTGVVTSDLAYVLGLPVAPASVSISDTAAHLLSSLSTVVSDIGKIGAINVTSGTLTLSAASAEAAHVDDGAGSVIDLIAGHSFNVANATVANLPGLLALPDAPGAISITDSSANIAADLTSGMSLLAAHPGTISSIAVTHGVLSLTDAQADMILATPMLDAMVAKLAAGTAVMVSGVPVGDVGNLAGGNLPNLTLAVADTPAAIAADLASGSGSVLATHAGSLGSVTLTADGTVGAQTLTAMAGLPGFSVGGHALGVQDTAAAILGLSPAQLGLTSAVSVHDSDANVAGSLDALQARFDGALSITLTNGAPSLDIGEVQYLTDQPTIDAITNPGVVTVFGSAGYLAELAPSLAADQVVGQVGVFDGASDVISNLASLQVLGGKLAVTLTDTSLPAAYVIPLLSIAHLSPSNIPVVDTGSAIAAVAESGNAAAIAYLNANGAALSGNSAVGAIDAANLEGLSNFNLAGHTLQVWDTASHLSSAAYASALRSSDVSGVYLKAPGGLAVVSAATAVTLFGIPGFSTHNPDGSSNVLTVSDSAAHIDAALGSLGGVSSFVVNSSGAITQQVLADLQGVGAQTALGVSLTVSDTAAHIADAAGMPVPPGAIQPVAYTLSANGSVTESEAVSLGNLAHFSAGGHTITLASGSPSLSISIADAQALANIAGALNLNGTALVVHGTVAQLSALSPAALGLVSPAVADSFANVASLPANSPLLHGTVEITDGAPVSAAEAQALLGLPIAPGSLTIDQTHSLTDSVADLRTLEASAAWTANPALHASFSLTAQDSVANLTSAANAGLLAGVAASTLTGNVTLDAADAASLAAVASSIHFVGNGVQIAVADTAAHLLTAAAGNGLSLATSVTLSGPDSLDAADTEQLLQINHLQISTPLSVIDSSANLLDGVLSGAIAARPDASHISVQLAGPETLDADTAEALAHIPGFNDAPGDLTIADATAYLLDPNNLSAEQIATVVTLDGDETVSANTVLRLSEVPHFTAGSSHLVLAGNDFADAPTIKAIADMGGAFQANGHSITLTQDVSGLTPAEEAALQTDNIVANGHMMTVTATGASVNATSLSATGVAGGTVSVYDDQGNTLSSTPEASAGFTVSVPSAGHNFTVMESFTGGSVAPLVVLDATTLENTVALAHGSFASSGAIAVDGGKFVDLYLAGTVPVGLTHAALVYDPTSHQVSLDVPGSQPVTLVTLGGSAHPASLSVAEILIRHAG